jgi:hypothetical protein
MTAERNVCQDVTFKATIPTVLFQAETQLPRVRALMC